MRVTEQSTRGAKASLRWFESDELQHVIDDFESGAFEDMNIFENKISVVEGQFIPRHFCNGTYKPFRQVLPDSRISPFYWESAPVALCSYAEAVQWLAELSSFNLTEDDDVVYVVPADAKF
jgi:hypothetical protein